MTRAPKGTAGWPRPICRQSWSTFIWLRLLARSRSRKPERGHGRANVEPTRRETERGAEVTEGKGNALSPMTMEAIADEMNLRMAFAQVAANRGAPGPDRQTIDEVRKNLDECLSQLHRCLLEGTYRVGDVRRVWIPKASGGQRGLGVPNVIDRIVQQAVHQIRSLCTGLPALSEVGADSRNRDYVDLRAAALADLASLRPAEPKGDYNVFGYDTGQYPTQAHDLVADPKFAQIPLSSNLADFQPYAAVRPEYFRLSSTSPAKGKAHASANMPDHDFYGKPRGPTANIGAIE